MVDKLDVRIPADAQLTPEFGKLYADTRGNSSCWRPSPHYTCMADLRQFGYDAIVHLASRHQRAGEKGHSHKMELIDTGQSTYSSWLTEIERIFEVPTASKKSQGAEWQPRGVRELQLMRIDLAADVPNVPVDWFRTRMRVLRKQRGAEVGKYMDIWKGKGETLYFGERTNCFRVYDKTAELHEQYRRLVRSVSADAEPPPFEEVFQASPDATLTRVERQFGNGRLPAHIKTLAQLTDLAEFDPFANVEILPAESLPIEEVTGNCVLSFAGERIRQLVQDRGLQRTRQLIRLRDPRNASRTLQRLAPFLRIPDNREAVTRERLVELYRDTVSAQLVA